MRHVWCTPSFWIVICVGAVVALRLVGARRQQQPTPVQVVRVDSALWKKVNTGTDLYAIRFQGKDLGGIEVAGDRVLGVMILAHSVNRQIVLRAKEGKFFGRMSYDIMKPGHPYQSLITVVDEDLDGIPDQRMDWETETLFVHDAISWKPKRPKTRPARSAPPGSQ